MISSKADHQPEHIRFPRVQSRYSPALAPTLPGFGPVAWFVEMLEKFMKR